MPTVLCDSGPLIALAKVGRLRLLLDLWGIVHVTEEVYQEAVAFGHALTLKHVLVLVDDEDARTEARRLGLPVRGTIGVLVEAHRRALVTLSEIELLFNEISARPDIWISANLCARVLKSLRSE